MKTDSLRWSRCRQGKPSSLGRRQVWNARDGGRVVRVSIERFPEGSGLYLVIDLDAWRVVATARTLAKAKRMAARAIAPTAVKT